jgi:hypothetical protein
MGRKDLAKTEQSLYRSERLVNDTVQIGVQTAETLQAQGEQLEKVSSRRIYKAGAESSCLLQPPGSDREGSLKLCCAELNPHMLVAIPAPNYSDVHSTPLPSPPPSTAGAQ